MPNTPLWTIDEIIKATSGRLAGTPTATDYSGIGFDSREVKDADIFVALKGVRDGHDFVPTAFEAGAGLAITEKPVGDYPCVVVADTLKALEDLGVFARTRATGAKRGAVTGSVGKTSVTQMVMAALVAQGHAHSSIKSFNNHIGVPLTLSRMPRDTERAVFEIGMNHADEITPLSQFVAPDVVVITTVGAVHTENFPDGEQGVARAKAEIFEGLKSGGLAILNADNAWFEYLKSEALQKGAKVTSFGEQAGTDARLLSHTVVNGRAEVVAQFAGKTLNFSLSHTGKHQALNAMASLMMAEALGVSRETAIVALSAFAALDGRGAVSELRLGDRHITLMDESYNANPMSMRASFKTLKDASLKAGARRVVVLSDMLELGPDELKLHAELAQSLMENHIDTVFCCGPRMKALWDVLPEAQKGGYAETAAALLPSVLEALKDKDVVMVKGSNGSKAGLIAKSLKTQ